MIISLICACSVLGGCKDRDKKTYIDLDSDYSVLDSELAEKLEKAATPLDTVVTDYNQHTYNRYGYATFDDRYLYCYTDMGYDPNNSWDSQVKQLYKIDILSGEVIPMCDDPGCTHDYETYPYCINNNQVLYYHCCAVGDELWCIDGSKIVVRKGGSSEVIFENSYCGEFEENYYKDSLNAKYSIHRFEVDDDYIYIFGPSYTYRVDRKTMKAEKPIVICDYAGFSVLASGAVAGSKMYTVNDLDEMFLVDYETGEATKIFDKRKHQTVYNETLYYIRWDSDLEEPSDMDDYPDWDSYTAAIDEYLAGLKPVLCSSELDGSNEKELFTNIAGDYAIKDGKVFYHEFNGDESYVIRCHDLETGKSKVIYDDLAYCSAILTAEHIDRIFFIGDTAEQYVVDEDGMPIPIYTKIISLRADGSDMWEVTVDGTDEVLY